MNLNALQGGKFEIWFVRFTDPETTQSVMVDFMKFPEEELCRVVFEAEKGKGLVVIDTFEPGTLRASSYSLKLRLGPNVMEHDGLKAVVGKRSRIEIDLTCDPGSLAQDYNPPILKRLKLFDMTSVTPALDARFSGMVRIGEREHHYSRVPGTQSHYWGRRFFPGWVYLSCNTFLESDLIFEVNAPKLPLLGITKGAGFVRYDGNDYSFNKIRTTMRKVQILQDGREGIWVTELAAPSHKFAFTVTAPPNKMLLIHNREGQQVLYTGRADCLCTVYERHGPVWRKKEDIKAKKTCAAELSYSE